jgi:ABC-type bacteriocin/lantibiotic exporter with double-glycine peptidase domain
MVVSMIVAVAFGKGFFKLRGKAAAHTDGRIKSTSDALSGMLSVKAFGWEQPFIDKIATIREQEAGTIRKSQAMSGINLTLQVAAPAISSMVIFVVHWRLGNELELSTVLTTIALLQVLRTSIGKKFVRFMESFPEAHAAMYVWSHLCGYVLWICGVGEGRRERGGGGRGGTLSIKARTSHYMMITIE